MKQFYSTFLLTILIGMIKVDAYAYDIAVNNADGVTIYYNYINDGKELEVTYRDQKKAMSYQGSIVIPDEVTYMNRTRKVTSIGDEAFNHCYHASYKGYNLKSVEIPNSVTSIGGSAFKDCKAMVSITIPNSVTSIGGSAFYGCSALTSITIPNSVASIEESVFFACNSLTSITIPNSVASIEKSAFCGCNSLTSITIPNSVTSIGVYAFAGCSHLTTITIFDNLRNIEKEAFSSCDSIKEVKVIVTDLASFCNNKLLPLIAQDAHFPDSPFILFDHDGNEIKDYIIPNSVTSIRGKAFWKCSHLTSITIPNTVTSIGAFAFGKCSQLASVTIPSSITKIEDGTFFACGFTTINIPNSVTSIGTRAFEGCGLASIMVPNSVKSIGEYAFYNCRNLASVTIPNSVTSIGKDAFAGCEWLTSVITHIKKPFEIDYFTFSSNTFYNASLYVPIGCIDKYKSTKGWAKFVYVEENLEGYVRIGKGTLRDNFFSIKDSGEEGIETDIDIYQDDSKENVFIIPYPYDGIANGTKGNRYNGSEEMEIEILKPESVLNGYNITIDDLVYFKPVNTGFYYSDYSSYIYAYHPSAATNYPTEGYWTYNKVLSYQSNGWPEKIQLAPIYYTPTGSWDRSQQDNAIIITFPPVPAGINDVKMDEDKNSRIYDLFGRRLEKPQKGINIIGGKKVLVK